MFILKTLVSRINNYNEEIEKIDKIKSQIGNANMTQNDIVKVQTYLLRTSIL